MREKLQSHLCLTLMIVAFFAIAAVAQNAPGQGSPVLGPTAFPTGAGAWIAPPGTSVSFNRTTGQASFALPTQPIDGSREQIARFEHWSKHPYPGTGPYPSTREENSELATHTLYYPADLKAVPGKMPVILFANGGCRNTSVEFTRFLGELASHGYFVAAIGRSDIPFPVGFGTAATLIGERKPGDTRPLQNASPADMLKALDYAIAENARQGSKFFGKVDTAKVATLGQSCGGGQAFNAARDPRVTTVVALNSSFRTRQQPAQVSGAGPGRGGAATPNAYAGWFAEDLKIPGAVFSGGPADAGAFVNGERAYQALSGAQPAAKVDMPLMGHTGAYPMPDIRWTNAVLAWLDFTLKNDPAAKAMFAGGKCGLCADPDFWVKSKGIN
jgi:dienelactone hydrolase